MLARPAELPYYTYVLHNAFILLFTGDLTILMVVGGHPDPAHYDVELIDMTNQGRTCRKPDNYPGSERGAVGAYIGGRVKVCGGYVETSACYDYNPEDGTWIPTTPMNVIRYFATSTVIQDQWWITGRHNMMTSGKFQFFFFNISLMMPRYHMHG